MEQDKNKRYSKIYKKSEIPKGHMEIRNRFTYFPLYDVERNSFIRRYRLWAAYRDKCIADGKKYVSCSDYAKIINKIGQNIEDVLLTDPDGVRFRMFKLKMIFTGGFKGVESLYPAFVVRKTQKKKDAYSSKHWSIKPNYQLLKRAEKVENKMDFRRMFSREGSLAKKLDIFDDF